MINRFSCTAFALLLVFMLFGKVNAQWNFAVSTDQQYNSNPFRSTESSSDLISSYDIGVEKELDSFAILYYGSYTTFQKSADRNYYWHQFGFYQSSESSLWGIYGENRINKEDANYFDYLNIAGYYKYNFEYLDMNWTVNTSANVMNYQNLSDFNNWVGVVGLSVNKSFETKTTIIGSINYNYKGFKNSDSSTVTYISPGGGGYGHGKGAMNNEESYSTSYTRYDENNVNVDQLVYNLRLSQAIFENTGLALNFNGRKILSGKGFGASLIESTYGEFELYDDPLSQDGYSAGIMLSQVISSDFIVRAGYTYYDKKYPAQGIYLNDTEYDESVLRQDYQSQFYFTANKTFYLDENYSKAIQLTLNYGLINNLSNSFYYKYDNQLLSLSVNFQF